MRIAVIAALICVCFVVVSAHPTIKKPDCWKKLPPICPKKDKVIEKPCDKPKPVPIPPPKYPCDKGDVKTGGKGTGYVDGKGIAGGSGSGKASDGPWGSAAESEGKAFAVSDGGTAIGTGEGYADTD